MISLCDRKAKECGSIRIYVVCIIIIVLVTFSLACINATVLYLVSPNTRNFMDHKSVDQ